MNLFSWANSLDSLGTRGRLVAQVILVSLSNSLDSISSVSHCLSTTHRPHLYHVPSRSEKVFP